MKTNPYVTKYLTLAALTILSLRPTTTSVTAQTVNVIHNFVQSDGSWPYAALVLNGNTLYGTTYHGGNASDGTIFKVNTDGTGFTVLHSFSVSVAGKNSDGFCPAGRLMLNGSTLYGTAAWGGSSGCGTVFSINTDGTGFTNLYVFSGVSDAANPWDGLVLNGNTLYGTTEAGGSNNDGTIFKINTDGTDFSVLKNFSNQTSDGVQPRADLVWSGNTLYGTTLDGSSSNSGTVFSINTDGTGFTNLYIFSGGSDGGLPYGGLVLSGNTLYGTTENGGNSNNGVVFKINTDGTDFTVLKCFSSGDGARPQGDLLLNGGILYGTASSGGSSGQGTIFAMNTDGTGFTNLYSFSGGSDGADPSAGLVLSGNTLCGTTISGGSLGYGTVFSLTLTLPPLLVTTAGNTPVVFYQNDGFLHTLQMTTNLASGTWTTVSNGVPLIGVQVTNLLNQPGAFFRLQ